MVSSKRYSTMAVLVLSVLLAADDVQAFFSVPSVVRYGRGRSAAATAATAATRLSGRRAACCTPLSMSEMEEDYPSDTGDDRFSAEGW